MIHYVHYALHIWRLFTLFSLISYHIAIYDEMRNTSATTYNSCEVNNIPSNRPDNLHNFVNIDRSSQMHLQLALDYFSVNQRFHHHAAFPIPSSVLSIVINSKTRRVVSTQSNDIHYLAVNVCCSRQKTGSEF